MQQQQTNNMQIKNSYVTEFYNSNIQFLKVRNDIEYLNQLKYSCYEMKVKVDNFRAKYRELVEKLFGAYCIHFVKKNYNIQDPSILAVIVNLHNIYKWRKTQVDAQQYISKKDLYKFLAYLNEEQICWLMSACDVI